MITKISLPTNDEKIYEHMLRFMNFGMGLTAKEIAVLSEFVRLNNEYSALPSEKRAKFIFSTDMRKEVTDKLEITDKSLNNILSRLRSKTFLGEPILSKDNDIASNLLCKPSKKGYRIEIDLVKE